MSNFPFSFMKENYVSSKTHEPVDFVTEHWNVFGDDFIKLFDNQKSGAGCCEMRLLWA